MHDVWVKVVKVFKPDLKQMHNIFLSMCSQNPLIITAIVLLHIQINTGPT